MSDNFDSLYEEIIRDHYKNPQHKKPLEHIPFVQNPSCGDKVRVAITLGPDGTIAEAAFDGSGCSISMSSADVLADLLAGKTPQEAKAMVELFLAVLRGEKDPSELEQLGDAMAFQGLVRLPVRLKCAALSWRAALEQIEKLL
ncbi:MAG TPA: SUF system NifU family Fe-S cluster assembly protein [Treponema sp.]|jgi:nitrogen fixation NifU-like protein|uniref:Fe-S cluster assembly sulfur transfer protein SufU n=1 Tax=Gracilinema caldarium TaxID=215591 RepID=UPI00168E0EC1|nr:SUF system NifU family Fe-S cluster assembly protein [Gracilinema caldarium]NLJ08821.1 SUF system NifU family Fe-S cluster assembly protein [Treponema sp.]HON14590.1 SUF system NifU family Fe-S cluster assembly protein [Treponema sp.]HRU27701.1 SUF system NifU family Fe-S cluster assembly protein [Treponema sp.]